MKIGFTQILIIFFLIIIFFGNFSKLLKIMTEKLKIFKEILKK